MKIKSTLIITLWVLLFFTSSCCNKAEESARYSLSDDDKSFIPYLQGQELNFVHSGGAEFVMKVINLTRAYAQTMTEHCNDDYIVYEYEIAEIFSPDPELYVSLLITPRQFNPDMLITVNNTHFILPTNDPPQYDTLNIGGTIFTNVYMVKNNASDTTVIEPNRVYFNKQYGVLEIKLTNNDSYYFTE
jgi:hypothetical protein